MLTTPRVLIVSALLAAAGCGESPPPTAPGNGSAVAPGTVFLDLEPVPYDAEEAAAYAARVDELGPITCGDRVAELHEVIPDELDVELDTPEAAWAYLTDPATPHPQRLRAAHVAAQVIPFSWLSRVVAARKQLRAEQRLHQWGRRGNPTGAMWLDEPREWQRVKELLRTMPDEERRRTLVGHEWTVPSEPQGFLPFTWKEGCDGPWPPQVEAALETLLRAWAPHVNHRGRLAWTPEHVEEWLQQVLALPMEDDQDVWFLHELAIQWTDAPDIRVFARFHDVLRDSRFTALSGQLAESVINTAVRWRDRDAGAVCQVLVLDFWASEQPEDERQRAGYTLRSLTDVSRRGGSRPGDPWPATVMLEACRRGLDSDTDDAWSRLYCYLFSVCEAHPDPPFRPTRHEDPDTAEEWIERFRPWFDEHEDELQEAAARERDGIERARRRLLGAR